ncbi:hypothetical protein C8R44DRAFT_228900 [Mycena epipterygia]|nr:hypothetical protein C8R44DRAFT_228900 [Mycena epipterygia]
MSRSRAPNRASSAALQAVEEGNTVYLRDLTSNGAEVHRNETTALNNADWTLGTALALMSYWVSLFQEDNPGHAQWFSDDDLRSFLGTAIVGFCGILWFLVCVTASFDGGLRLADLLVETDGDRIVLSLLVATLCTMGCVSFLVLATWGAYELAHWVQDKIHIPSNRLPRLPAGLFHASDWYLRYLDDSTAMLLIRLLVTVVGTVGWFHVWTHWMQIQVRSVIEYPPSLSQQTRIIGLGMTASAICSYITWGVIRMVSRWMGWRQVSQ